MENKKDIGAFLKSKLDLAKKAPAEGLWERINHSLEQKQRRRKRAFLLLIPTIAVLGILAFYIFQEGIGDSFVNESEKFSVEEIKDKQEGNKPEEQIIIKNTSEVKIEDRVEENKDKTPQDMKGANGNKVTSQKGKTKYANSIKLKNDLENSNEAVNNSYSEVTKNSSGDVESESVANSSKSDSETVFTKFERDSIIEKKDVKIDSTVLAKIEKIKKEKKKETDKDSTEIPKTSKPKWTVMAIGGPLFYKVSEKNSAIDQSLDGTETEGKITFAYGVGVGFNLNERLSLSYAAVRTKLDYTLKNISTSTPQDLSRILSYSAIVGQNNVSLEEFSAFRGNDSAVNFRQEIEYIEMPLQLNYQLSESKLGLQVFGGVSTYLLTEDAIYIENSGNEKLNLGSANNLSKINFSVNAGFGVYYKLSKNFTVDINPTFKYHFKMLDSASRNTSGVLLGFYTGIKYNLNSK